MLFLCYALVVDCASGSVVTWQWESSRKATKNCRKTVVSPLLPPLKEGTPRPYLLALCERVSCMRLSSMVRDSAEVSVVTVDAFFVLTFCFAGYSWCIGASL